jgi:hypothetical protein
MVDQPDASEVIASDVIAAVVAEARRSDPSLPEDVAALLATQALGSGARDAPEIARALLDADGSVDVSWANAVATAVAGLTEGPPP